MTDEQIEEIAERAHEANRAYCESVGDTSQPPWANAPRWQHDSALDGVRFTLANPAATPEDSHANWLRAKAADGWTWGPEKDPPVRKHPCMVPYDELPEAQRIKDAIFLAVVRSSARLLRGDP